MIAVHHALPALAQDSDSGSRGNDTGNPLTVDYVLPDWEADPVIDPPVRVKPAVYEDGTILIYHYQQLLLIGKNDPVTDTDYLTNRCGAGQPVVSDQGQEVRYAPDAVYRIVQDIPLPRHTVWNPPADFTGSLIGSPQSEPTLYDAQLDTVYLYNLLQTAVMSSSDADTQPVMSGDAAVSGFGSGNAIFPYGNEKYLTYSRMHRYVLAKDFSSDLSDVSPSVNLHNRVPANRAAVSLYDGRDFQGQVIKKIDGVPYVLIGNQEQLRAIGSDQVVFTPVYKMKLSGTKYVVDTAAANGGLLYGGDADLLASQNGGSKDFDFQQIDSATLRGGVDQETMEPVYNALASTWKTDYKYSRQQKYIIFRDIDLGGLSNPWTPLMFSGTMTGAVAENGEKLWNGTGVMDSTAITAARRAVISNIYVNQDQPIEVNQYIGIGFFATITNEINTVNVGMSAGTVTVSNLELNQVEVHNTTTSIKSTQTILNFLTTSLGWLVGSLVQGLLTVVSFGSINMSLNDTLSALLNARASDPTIFSTGAFAGRIVGDVVIENCSVTGDVTVENLKDDTGGFVGYTNGVTEYSGLSQVLGGLTDVLTSLLNVIPGLGLGDLITILLNNALPLSNLVPTGYIEPHINNCTVENLRGTVGQNNTYGNGGFAGMQIGTIIRNCHVLDSTYTVNTADYGGGFSGVARDAVIQGTLNGLGLDILDVTQIVSDLAGMERFQTQSLLQNCTIQDSTVTVAGQNYLGGFSGAMAASYAIDCDIKGTVSNPLSVSGSGCYIGGFVGGATIGWANSIGKDVSDDKSLLSVVRQVASQLLSSEASANQKLLSLVGLVPSAMMGCRIDAGTVNVSGGSLVGGFAGNGQGGFLTESSADYLNQLTYWETHPISQKTARPVELKQLESVHAHGNYVGGAAGEMGSVSLAGVLDQAVTAGTFVGFHVSQVTVTGVESGYMVLSDGTAADADGDDVSGGFGMTCGGTIDTVRLENLRMVEAANQKAAGFVGTAGPGDMVGSGGLTLNLLGLNNVLNVKNLLSVGQGIHVRITDSVVTGVDTGYTVESKGSGYSNEAYQYLAAGFVAQSNSTEMTNCHADRLRYVKAASRLGYSGGFVGVSQTGGLADVSDVNGIEALLTVQGNLLGAIRYLVPSYTNCTVTFVDGGYVDADIAGGFAADFQSGRVDNASIADVDDPAEPEWTKTMPELFDRQAVNPSGDLEKQFAVFNIASVRGRTYAGGFGGKLRSGALAGSGGGISILGQSFASISLNELLGVINAYVPIVHHAGVYSQNGYRVAANEIRSGDPYSGSAGGFVGYASGAQISQSDVWQLSHTEVSPPEDLEGIAGTSYFVNTQSTYAVVGGHYAGGYVGNLDIGDAASVGSGLKVLGSQIRLTNVLSALNVVVSTIEHSDVQGAAGGFSVIADGTDNGNKVGMSGGYAGAVYGGHVQNSHCKNFYYIIGQETAGGYVGNMEPGNAANLLDDGSLLSSLIDVDAALASLVEDFVPTLRNSTTSCVPCGGAVRAQGASDAGHQRGCAGGYCGHNEGGHIWGLNDEVWKAQDNSAATLPGTTGTYQGEQHIAAAWRIRSVYGYEYAGGFTGYMESADTASTGNIGLLGGLIQAENLLNALSVVYPTEKHTAVYGPLRNIDLPTWNAWVTYIGKFGGYGRELARIGTISKQSQLDKIIEKYIYGSSVAAGRNVWEEMLISAGGIAGGHVGLMVTGVISDGQSYDIRQVRAMQSAGGYAGKMQSGGAAEFGSVSILGLGLNLGALVQTVKVFVPTVRSGTVYGWQSGLTVTAFGTDFVHHCGYAGGYVGSACGAQIWGDKGVNNGPASGCHVINLRYVRGTNAVGGYVGMATAASVADVNTNSSNGLLQKVLDSLISTPNDLASVLQATVTTIRQAEIRIIESDEEKKHSSSPDRKDFGFSVEGVNGTAPRFAGGFAGSLEASVIGSRQGQSNIIVNDLRRVNGQFYAGGFVGLADVGSVASVSSSEGTEGGSSILGLIQAGGIDLLDVFRTYIYYAEVSGVSEGIVVTAEASDTEGILGERRYSGCAGGFGGGVMNGTVKNSSVKRVNTVTGVNYTGGFVGHLGKNGVADVDSAQVANLLGVTAGVLDVFGSHIEDCSVEGADDGMIVVSRNGNEPFCGGFTGYADVSRIKNSHVTRLKQVDSDQIAGGFAGKTDMHYLIDLQADSPLVNILLIVINYLVKALYVTNLENVGLLELSIPGLPNVLSLKVLSDGDVLYLNLLGLKISASLVKATQVGETDTAVITLGDSSVRLPCSDQGIDTTGDNAEVAIQLLKGNATKIENSTVTGIDIGYDVYGGGATHTADGTHENGYAGGFVGYNNEGRLFYDQMLYCDEVRGYPDKVGHFTALSSLQTVYDHTADELEKTNRYSVYRNTGASYQYALTQDGALIGTAEEDHGTSVFYNRFDLVNLAPPISYYSDWQNAVISETNSTVNAETMDVYVSSAKAVLMSDTPTGRNPDSLVPEPAEMQDPCEPLIHLTLRKIWKDFDNESGDRPDTIQVRLIQHWLRPDGTEYLENGVPRTEVYRDTNVIPDADAEGWFTLTKNDNEREGSAAWVRVIEDLPAAVYSTDPVTGARLLDHYASYTAEEKAINDYTPVIRYDASGTEVTITNSHDITVLKTDEKGNGLSGAAIDLYYRDTASAPSYTFNEPVIPPESRAEVTVNGEKPSSPGLGEITESLTVTTYTYSYSAAPTLPHADEQQWILPTSDNDYLYFRDYNAGTPADVDKQSFAADNGSDNPSAAQNGKRSWLETNLKDNEQSQHLELDDDHSYWYAAQFSGTGRKDVQYVIRERFVDRYAGQDTVVWKIQPPDGYDKVRFCLYDGGQCIRTTETVTFRLGQMWHKQNWGGFCKIENGQTCYFNVPLEQETDWALYHGTPYDKRMDWSQTTTLQQAVRFTPSGQKVIFYCNSNQVWHNPHIEFFRDVRDGETPDITLDGHDYRIVGQQFPGYLMEPYAYGDEHGRVGNYPAYEMTIPQEAQYFRVNNGVDGSLTAGSFNAPSSPYAYRSAVTALKGSEQNGKKNFDNYYSFGDTAVTVTNGSAPSLLTWSGTPSADNRSRFYAEKTADSDCDYIYFEAPANWGTHIYAYFYGGGNLREDNWVRSCYSVWPGVAAAASEYTASGAEAGHSDLYGYPLSSSSANPDSSYTDQNNLIVYKFRVPEGDCRNVNKVIFNNGLKSQLSGGDGKTHETGVIVYQKGYLYTAGGSALLHHEAAVTNSFEQRGDTLYIKNTAGWDDIHIRFYRADGTQMLQSGEGYLMQYSGRMNGKECFRIAIPKDAEKFSLSTGKQYSSTGIKSYRTTGIYDLLRKADAVEPDRADYTLGSMVFELTGTDTEGTLSMTYPAFAQVTHTQTYTSTDTVPALDAINQSPRGDYLYLKDSADVMADAVPTISFSTADGTPLATPAVLKLDEDSDHHRWYRVGIPTNAAVFSVNGGPETYPVYPKSSVPQVNVTPGDLYYETDTLSALSLLWPTFTVDDAASGHGGVPDEELRGDTLYLVHAEGALSDWSGMKVTFYDASGVPIDTNDGNSAVNVTPLGLLTAPVAGSDPVDGAVTDNADAQGYWYSTAVPYGAAGFTVTNGAQTITTARADIFELREKLSRYSKDYTLGDMQYRLDGTAPRLIYPVFTQDDTYSFEYGNGQTISSASDITRADASLVENYANAAAAAAVTQSDSLATLPVLRETDTNTITYSWGSGASQRSAVYQPEDRYGYIRSAASANDTSARYPGELSYAKTNDNFITIKTDDGSTLTDPYIMFYSSDNAAAGTEIGGTATMAANGISLVKARLTGDDTAPDNTNPYRIRLPKNARSFRLGAGADGAQGGVIRLYETIQVKCADGTLRTAGETPYLQITDYHHAGTTFTVGNDGNVTGKTLRTGKTVPVQTITDPLCPRSDNDYIFLTDVGNSFADNGTVFAYYYGGADGEYAAWPGIRAGSDDQAPLVSIDNDGNRVYRFRLPKVTDGKYPYVIFNNGSATDGTRRVTQKIDLMETEYDVINDVDDDSYIAGGMRYRVDASDNTEVQHYGTYDSAANSVNYVDAYLTTDAVGEENPTVSYSSNRMIYLVNNGTKDLADHTVTNRLLLDDMHIVFYDKDKELVSESAGTTGYLPDKLMNGSDPVSYSDSTGPAGGGDLYRISVPAGAVYFRITNGVKAGAQHQYQRQSEMKSVSSNGLYRFVPEADSPENYLEEPSAAGNLNEKHFLLELVNRIVNDDEEPPESETYDVRLATVVSGDDGKQEKIIWLRMNQEGTEVDRNYLDHTTNDIWQQDGDAEVGKIRLTVDAGRCYWKETAAPDGYKLRADKLTVTSVNTVMSDEPLPDRVILKKTAKEKVGTKEIGDVLAGARFKLCTVNSDGSLGALVPLVKVKHQYEYAYKPDSPDALAIMAASGEYETNGTGSSALVDYNVMSAGTPSVYDLSRALVTGSKGRLKLDNLPYGDYCLVEVQAPAGYSELSRTGDTQQIFFSVGKNTAGKNLVCTDEMAPAYLKLYEHIDVWNPGQWGNPAFIFRIRQTGYYDYSGNTPTVVDRSGEEIMVVITVNDEGKYTAGLVSKESPSYDYRKWYQEATDETADSAMEYAGQFRIDEQGRIRLEPGRYEITRMPVSRYEFVENTYTMDNDSPDTYQSHRTQTEKLVVTVPAERTAIVHYYDRAAYCDKFSQTDTRINRFYTLENGNHKTVKGFRIADYHQIGTAGEHPDTDADTMTFPVTMLTIYQIYADGSEKEMSSSEKEALTDFTVTNPDGSGLAAEDFSFDSSTGKITIRRASDYRDGVYTLNAVHHGTTTAFDLVFLRSS